MATLAPLRARTTGRPPASAATALPPRYRSHTATAVPSINARAIVTLTGMAPRGPAAPPREKFGRSNVIPAWWNRKKNTPPILSTSSVSGAPSGSAAVASQGMACASNTTITNARAALPTAFPHPEVSTSAPPAPAAAAGIAAIGVVGAGGVGCGVGGCGVGSGIGGSGVGSGVGGSGGGPGKGGSGGDGGSGGVGPGGRSSIEPIAAAVLSSEPSPPSVRAVPQVEQKRAPSGFSLPQFGHLIPVPPSRIRRPRSDFDRPERRRPRTPRPSP